MLGIPPLHNISEQGLKQSMPNWVHQTLTVTEGNADELFEYIRSEPSLFDFDKLIPVPEALKGKSGTKSAVAVLCARNEGLDKWSDYPWVRQAGITTPAALCKHFGWSYEEMVGLGNQLLENEKRYGAQTWYE
jgi:hypothetical protein